jgi:uncharacterized small protein (DUF1192 family)
MAFLDDEAPKKKLKHELGEDVTLLSEAELLARVDLLKAEIARLEAAASARRASKAAADQVFKL